MLEAWLTYLRLERGFQPLTIATYERELCRLAKRGPIESLGAEDLRAELESAGGVNATVSKRISAYRSFYKFLYRRGYRADDPATLVDRPKVRPGLPRPVEDVDAKFKRLGEREQHVAILLLETGLRIGEALALHVTPPAPAQLVITSKGGYENVLPLTELARYALDQLGGRVDVARRTLQKRFRAAGFTAHELRHTFGCDLADGDADLGEMQDLMRHRSPQTTRIYVAYKTSRLRRALERRPSREGLI